jgi:excisionase family DNA binding protein
MSEQARTLPELLTIREACDYLRIGRTTFYELVKSGDVRPLHVRGRRLVRLAALDELLLASEARNDEGREVARPVVEIGNPTADGD